MLPNSLDLVSPDCCISVNYVQFFHLSFPASVQFRAVLHFSSFSLSPPGPKEKVCLFLQFWKNGTKVVWLRDALEWASENAAERASEDGVTGRVFIQFTIDIEGNVNDLLIKARKKDQSLEAEIRRVIKKLPKFYPGYHKGLPVNVKYSLPINFSTE